jgi:hypothetical protein
VTDTKESPSTLERALAFIYEDMDQIMGLGPHGRGALGREPAKRYVWQAIERGYRLALVAAIEECETYAKDAKEPIRSAIMHVAVRIAQRAKDAERLARPVGAGIPEGFLRANREAPSIEDALAVQQGSLFSGIFPGKDPPE